MNRSVCFIFDAVPAVPSRIRSTTPRHLSDPYLLCSACQSFDQELKRSSGRRSRPLGVPQTITVNKGPKVWHLARGFHSNCGQHSQKSGFWVKIHAPETGKLHFPTSMTLSPFSREVLTMTALIRELVDAICIYLRCNFASWQSKASTCVGLEEYFSRSNTSRPHHIPAFSGTQLSADNWIISGSVCAPVLNCARKESFLKRWGQRQTRRSTRRLSDSSSRLWRYRN